MATFVLFERNAPGNAPALGLVVADRLPDAEAMGGAMYNCDVIAYHSLQMPEIAGALAGDQWQADMREDVNIAGARVRLTWSDES